MTLVLTTHLKQFQILTDQKGDQQVLLEFEKHPNEILNQPFLVSFYDFKEADFLSKNTPESIGTITLKLDEQTHCLSGLSNQAGDFFQMNWRYFRPDYYSNLQVLQKKEYERAAIAREQATIQKAFNENFKLKETFHSIEDFRHHMHVFEKTTLVLPPEKGGLNPILKTFIQSCDLNSSSYDRHPILVCIEAMELAERMIRKEKNAGRFIRKSEQTLKGFDASIGKALKIEEEKMAQGRFDYLTFYPYTSCMNKEIIHIAYYYALLTEMGRSYLPEYILARFENRPIRPNHEREEKAFEKESVQAPLETSPSLTTCPAEKNPEPLKKEGKTTPSWSQGQVKNKLSHKGTNLSKGTCLASRHSRLTHRFAGQMHKNYLRNNHR